jgi:SPX domain protein involved in polyphosphate accumulation
MDTSKQLINRDWRFERKFIVSCKTLAEVESAVRIHPSWFKEIYHPRQINNIYFDTFNHDSFFDNVDGASSRYKVRLRWYGELLSINKPTLEIKVKRGDLGTKFNYPIPKFKENLLHTMKKKYWINTLQNKDLSPEVLLQLNALEPRLINRYKRKYFLSANKKFRVTLDYNQEFYRPSFRTSSLGMKMEDKYNIVVELKYGEDDQETANSVSSLFTFRLSKNSKFVNGINRIQQIDF